MADLINPYLNPSAYQRKFLKVTDNNYSRSYEQINVDDIDKLVSEYDRRTVLSASRKLYSNLGIVKGATLQKAYYSVGSAWDPKFKGIDKRWGKEAEEYLKNEFYPNSNIRGNNYNFKSDLMLDSIYIDRDGESFIVLTEDENGLPLLQRLGAHRIGQRYTTDDTVKSGIYKGMKIENGILFNRFRRPVAYNILGEDESKDSIVPASSMIHMFSYEWFEQGRGLSSGTHALDDLLKARRSEEWEQIAMMMVSSIGLIEYNDQGAANSNDITTILLNQKETNGDVTHGVTEKVFSGGTTRYYRSNSGNKIESIKHDRPGDLWERFQNRMAKHFIAGFNWSYAFAWDSKELNGTSQRAEIEKIRKAINARQSVLNRGASRMISYAIAKAIKNGRLKKNDEWFKWGFTRPAKFSIDPGKDTKAYAEEYKLGIRNAQDWCAEYGKNYEEHIDHRIEEIVLREKKRVEAEKKYGISIDPRELCMLTPNEAPQSVEEHQNNEDENDK